MTRKIKLEVILTVEGDNITQNKVDNMVQEVVYDFTSHTKGIEVADTEIRDYELIKE